MLVKSCIKYDFLFVFDAHSLVLGMVLVLYRTRWNRLRYGPGQDWFSGLHYREPDLILITVQSQTCD